MWTMLNISGFAALPKLPVVPGRLNASDSRVQLSTIPDDMDEESEIEALESQFRELEAKSRSTGSLTQDIRDPPIGYRPRVDSNASSTNSSSSSSGSSSSDSPSCSEAPSDESTDLHRWHANLEARLHPFWSTAISSRVVRLSLYTCCPETPGSDPENAASPKYDYMDDPAAPVVIQSALTSTDGAFQLQFVVSWETLCMHPGALQIAFGDREAETELFLLAELMPPPLPSNSANSSPASGPAQAYFPVPTTTSTIPIVLSHSRVRLISDIDDTVKLSHIISGARAVFRNVFVRELKDNVIDGMGDWYTAMWRRGVRFHYVVSLLPIHLRS